MQNKKYIGVSSVWVSCTSVCAGSSAAVSVSASASAPVWVGNNKWPGHGERKLLLQDAGPCVIIQMDAASYKLEIVSDLAGRKTRQENKQQQQQQSEGREKPKKDKATAIFQETKDECPRKQILLREI